MSEVTTPVFIKNNALYGKVVEPKNEGPACVDRKGEEVNVKISKPDETPIKAVREK
ncbi:1,4-beta-xylanase [Enterococcus faecium]|uniref:1,4-beta-xylanase n=1 Tax=Enterococcus faecium TaxID=1352 RepID=UPI00129CA9B7|nr:1,4-beta-xylanase [Enterococcus faecium]MRI47230.1 1,4-beta-xylanase [Enterococcus faecium]